VKNTLRTRNDWRRIVAECRALRRANAALVNELKEWNTCPKCGGPVTRHGFQSQARACASETCDWSSSGALLTEMQLAKLRKENAELKDKADTLAGETGAADMLTRERDEALAELAALRAAVRWTSTAVPKEHMEVLRRAVES
jgi:hypothetical protein